MHHYTLSIPGYGNIKIPVQKNYFGVRHGKSSCYACIGRVKQGVSRLVNKDDKC